MEASVDPAFEELNEQESARLYQRRFARGWKRRLDEDSPGLRRAFARLAWRDSWDDSPRIEQLQWAGRKLVEWRDYPAPWQARCVFARDRRDRHHGADGSGTGGDVARDPRRVTDNLV